MQTHQKLLTVTKLFLLLTIYANAQSGNGITGKIIDEQSGTPMEFVAVAAFVNDRVMATAETDENGYYKLKPLEAGSYTVKASIIGYHPHSITEVAVSSLKMTLLNIKMNASAYEIIGGGVEEYQIKLIDPFDATGSIIAKQDIKDMPYTSVNDIAATSSGVFQKEEGGALNIRGGRDNATKYIVDGIPLHGMASIPKSAIKEMRVLTGGIPAMFGDATGGIIVITTKGFTKW